jgi:hypothetical protein
MRRASADSAGTLLRGQLHHVRRFWENDGHEELYNPVVDPLEQHARGRCDDQSRGARKADAGNPPNPLPPVAPPAAVARAARGC